MKKLALFVSAAAMMAAMTACGGTKTQDNSAGVTEINDQTALVEATPADEAAPDVLTCPTDDTFRPGKAVQKVTVLDFNAVWCVPCKKLTPAYHLAAEQLGDQVQFYTIDIDKNKATADAFGIRSIPTVVILSPDGKMEKYVGLDPFVGGLEDNADADALTQVIAGNLVEKIRQAL